MEVVFYEVNWEIVLFVKGGKAFVALFGLAFEAGQAVHAGTWLCLLWVLALDLHLSFARLEHQRLSAKHGGGEEYWVLNLDEGAESTVIVFDKVLVADLLDVGVNTGD